MIQHQGNHVLKGVTNKRKNMLPIKSIFFPFRVAPMRTENNFKKQKIEKPPSLKLRQYGSLLKLTKF